MAEVSLIALSALHGWTPPAGSGGGVTIRERSGLGLATMQARKGQHAALCDSIRKNFLIELPDRPAIVSAGNVSFVGIGPQHWLAMSERGGSPFSQSLRALVAPLASVCDQSGGYAVFRAGGSAIRQTLAKGFPVDLDPCAFKIGDAATTIVSHIGATIWRRDDDAEGFACFEIALFRGFAASFADWFAASAAEFGCDWLTPAP